MTSLTKRSWKQEAILDARREQGDVRKIELSEKRLSETMQKIQERAMDLVTHTNITLKKRGYWEVEYQWEIYLIPRRFASYKNADGKVIQALMECKNKTSISVMHGSKIHSYYKKSDLQEVCEGLEDLEYATNIDKEGNLLITIYSFVSTVNQDIDYLELMNLIKNSNLKGFPTNRRSKLGKPILAYKIAELRQFVKLITNL